MKTITLKPGKEKSLLRRHPWVFDGAVAKGGGDPGETVRVHSAEGQFLAWGAVSPSSKIRVRVWSFDEAQRIDAAFFRATLSIAVSARGLFDIKSNGVRLVHGESDGLPGLVVDRYGDTLVAQFLSCGTERWKQQIADALLELTGLTRLYERSDASVRELEGLPRVSGWLRGQGDTAVVLQEHSWQLALDVAEGHKTGFYLDQRDNRQAFFEAARHARWGQVLNCFCYTGGFTVAALAGMRAAGMRPEEGHVTSIDSSGPALDKGRGNVALNGFDASQTTWLDADVNTSLRAFEREGRRFDAIVLDPPKLAPTAAHAERAARAYKDLNRWGFKLLNPGGMLFTYSCSGGIGVELFQKIVASAALEAGVDAFITHRLGGAPDHPVALPFPEGEYLKGLVVVARPLK
ncbi:MAG: 23S rRNA (cytosine(1962)-C(5))-methyltransferase RlmI [Polaromonas sp.]|nr:23S rRNA (cytosine(1962)-C(5))-methyltransferase RlmI [Polaromonas sp.]